MRGDAALTARLLLRGTGLAGMTVTFGGALAAVAATRPWYLAVADLSMLGEQQGRSVATLAGAPGTPWGWAVVALGIAAAMLGIAAAVDRPPRHVRRRMLAVAAGLLAVALIGALDRPTLVQVAGQDGVDLLRLAERLPRGVELAVSVQVGPGVGLIGVAALLVAAGAIALREDGA